jgi:hypothetical protein
MTEESPLRAGPDLGCVETLDFRPADGSTRLEKVVTFWCRGKKGLLRLDRLHQRYDPEDLHRTFHVVGQDVQAHLGSYVG